MSEAVGFAVDDLKAKIEADSRLRGRKLKFGKVTGPNLPDSNFDLEFENLLRQRLGGLIDNQSEFIVSGEYDQVHGTNTENQGLEVIQLVIRIVDRQPASWVRCSRSFPDNRTRQPRLRH